MKMYTRGRRGSYILKKEVSRTGEWELVREKVQVDPSMLSQSIFIQAGTYHDPMLVYF